MGNKKTCLATLLQNELNSDVARFTTHIKPVLQQIRLMKSAVSVFKSCVFRLSFSRISADGRQVHEKNVFKSMSVWIRGLSDVC